MLLCCVLQTLYHTRRLTTKEMQFAAISLASIVVNLRSARPSISIRIIRGQGRNKRPPFVCSSYINFILERSTYSVPDGNTEQGTIILIDPHYKVPQKIHFSIQFLSQKQNVTVHSQHHAAYKLFISRSSQTSSYSFH
jgi:hypothetical protein